MFTILTLTSISLFQILHILNNFLGKHSLCVSLRISFLRTVPLAA
jgi:hypothetical protein